MSCLGVHFALTESEVNTLTTLPSEEERLEHITEVIEEEYLEHHRNFIAESDKSWDAMHRLLADGYLTWDGGEYPLNHTILAGKLLYTQTDYIMSLKTPVQVRDISMALQGITEKKFEELYYSIDPNDYDSDLSTEDLEYTWEWFQNVRKLYEVAASEGRYVLFTADQ